MELVVATWNVADPHYFARFFDGPDLGFDWQPEPQRLDLIYQHVATLLSTAQVVGLQEVPAALVERLVALGATRSFQVQWVAAPSKHDEAAYARTVGRRGCSLDKADRDSGQRLANLPQVAHDVLFTSYTSLVEPPQGVVGTVAAALTLAPDNGAVIAAATPEPPISSAQEAASVDVSAGDAVDSVGTVGVADSWEDL